MCYNAGMAKKADFSRKILNTLSGKQAVKLVDLKDEVVSDIPSTEQKTGAYAVTRSIKNLAETGFIETIDTEQSQYARLTRRGKQKLASLKLDSKNSLASTAWDGKWRIVLLDLPETRKAEREALRYLLKKAGFVLLKNSAWISPFPFEFLFQNIKTDFGLTCELMIIVTDHLDVETEQEFKRCYSTNS